MDGGSEARRSRLRALRRGFAVFGLCAGSLFGFGLATASAQTVPCILVVCLPTPLPTVSLPLPTPTVSLPLPTLSLPVPTVSNVLPTSTTTVPVTLPTAPVTLPGVNPPPTPTPSAPLNGVTGSDSGCTVTVAGVCVLSSAPAGPTPPTCLTGSTDPTCILKSPDSSGSPGGTGGGGHNSGGGGSSGGAGGSADQPLATGTFSAFGGGGLNGSDPAGGAAQAIPLGLRVASIPPLEQLGPGSGFQFGHALILWPLFGLLDVLGLGAVYLVVRRFRATRSD